jgi:hypothetical protein
VTAPSESPLADPAWRRRRAARAGQARTTPEYHIKHLRSAVAESRAGSGLPDEVLDRLTLEQIAVLLDVAKS